MRFGAIPEYKIDIDDRQEGIPMVRVQAKDGRTLWVELHDELLDGKTICRDEYGTLIAR
jgi:hypothetical protein